MDMVGKWKLIAKWYREIGKDLIADKAENIRETLVELYGDECVNERLLMEIDEWLEELAKDDKWDMIHEMLKWLIKSKSLCKACVESEFRCEECKFGLRYGQCAEEGSLYREFVDMINWV